MTYKMQIPPDKVEQTRNFFKTRGGVLLWHDLEISMHPRCEVMTPATHEDGTPATRPNWMYGDPEPLRVEDIAIRDEKVITPPVDWFPACTKCEDGKYPLSIVAEARNVTLSEIKKAALREGWDEKISGNMVECGYCQGTGHVDRYITVRLKKNCYGGYELFEAGKKRARECCKKLSEIFNDQVLYEYENVGYGQAHLAFYTEKITPFTME